MSSAPPLRIADRVRAERRAEFIGRAAELDRLAAAAREDGPVVTFVLGIGGIGKTSLLVALGERLDRDAVPWRRRCRVQLCRAPVDMSSTSSTDAGRCSRSGYDLKGPVSGAIVTAHTLHPSLSVGDALGTTTTDETGFFGLQLPRYNGDVVTRRWSGRPCI